jgi:hypothetical protein
VEDTSEMVRQTQKINQLRQPEGILGESPLCVQKENGWGWLSKITAIFKSLGRPEMDNQIGEEVVRDGREIPAKESSRVPKPAGVRSNNTSKASGKSTGAAIRAAAAKGKSKSKAV